MVSYGTQFVTADVSCRAVDMVNIPYKGAAPPLTDDIAKWRKVVAAAKLTPQ